MKLQLLWLALVFIAAETNAAKHGKNATIPALIVFGDSIMDTGNNNRLPTLLKCNFPPYGKDFPGGLATGRFSDGRVPSDLIAFMNPNLKPRDLLKGVTFASGGTGYDPLTAKIMSVISVWDQLTYFKQYISTIKQHFGEKRARYILDHSFFVVCSSSNDLAHTFMAQSHKYDPTSYANFLADSAVKFVRELHKLGAKKIGVFSAVPVGCVPLQRTVFGGLFTRGCVESLNNMAKQFNARLSPALESLDKELDGVILIDVYDTLFNMIQHPSKYGFEVADRGCCGRGSLAISYMCNSLNPFTCSNSSAYIFWDSYHPTERAYQVIVDNLLDKYLSKLH
ncbi:GDSL esterase/lipase [Raphanus sativus]|nr:GDSL esterase/lipase [Raphanus sativus]